MKSLYCIGTCIQKRTLSLRSKQKITKDSEIILPNTLILDPIIKKPRAKKVKIEVPKIDQYLELKKEIKQKKSPKEENDSDLYTCLPSPHNLTSNSIIFTVIGPPKPLSRHRTGRGILYNPSSKYQKQFLKACKDYLPSKPFEGPLEAKVNFFFERPKNHYGKGNVLKNDQQYVMKRPDIDNLVKFVFDSLNMIAYLDDSQIVKLTSGKYYSSEKSRIEVHISSLLAPSDQNNSLAS